MCMEDVRIGRATTSREVDFVTTISTPQQLLPGSDDRIAVMLCPPLAGILTYSTNPKPVSGQGINLNPNSSPVQFDIQTDGDIVRKQWWVVDDGTSRVGAITETILKAGFNGS